MEGNQPRVFSGLTIRSTFALALMMAGIQVARGFLNVTMEDKVWADLIKLGLEPFNILSLYIWLGIVGGVLGDYWLGNQRAIIIGGYLQLLGVFFLFSMNPFVIISCFLMAFGLGLVIPNILAQLGRRYLNNPYLLDSVFLLTGIGIIGGSLLGNLLLTKVYREVPQWICICVLFLLAHYLAYANREKEPVSYHLPAHHKLDVRILIGLALILTILFNGINSVNWMQKVALYTTTDEVTPGGTIFWVYTLPSLVFMLAGFVLASVWRRYQLNPFTKLATGFLLGAVSCGAVFLLLATVDKHHPMVILSFSIFAVGGAFVEPIIYAVITQYANPRWLATFFGITIVFIVELSPVWKIVRETFTRQIKSPNHWFGLAAIIMVLIGGVLLYWQVQGRLTNNRSEHILDEELTR